MGQETTDKIKPIHKFNNGNGATLCKSCSVIIATTITQDLLCPECQEKALKLLKESVYFMNQVPNNSIIGEGGSNYKTFDHYKLCSKIDKFLNK